MTKKSLIKRILIVIALLLILAFLYNVKFMFDTTSSSGNLSFGSFHVVFNILMLIFIVCISLNTLHVLDQSYWDFEESDDQDGDHISSFFNFNISKWKVILFTILILLVYQTNIFYKKSKFMYNKSIIYHNDYIQTVQEKQGFYENLWNSYNEQKMISALGRDGFIELSKIIMENRKDGSKVAWKWVQETQQIPFSEFTQFYTNLSEFISSKRDDYLKIEMKCQSIANKNNTLLDTFPNNIYNKVIKCKRIDFEFGFANETPTEIFTTKN